MEVNIAIFVMSVGILSMVSLYSLGYREQSQSREDVEAAVMAENFLAPLVSMLSSPELGWQKFNSVKSTPENGWSGYIIEDRSSSKTIVAPRVIKDVNSKAIKAFNEIASKCKTASYNFSVPSLGSDDLKAALVVSHEENSPIIRLAFRSGKRGGSLLSQPLYYTEVHFQGDPNQ